MKIRMDFVTNSSSSAYIILSKRNLKLEQKYKDNLKIIRDAKDMIDYLEEIAYYGDITFEYSDPDFQKKFGFSDEQMAVIKAIKTDRFSTYDIIRKKLEELKNRIMILSFIPV